MKKCLIGVFALALFFAFSISLSPPAHAGQKNLKFAWEQVLPNPNDLSGWKVYKAERTGGPYELFTTVPFTSASQGTYTADTVLASPDANKVQYFFVMTAFDASGNESAYSNECNAWVDFEAPGVPITLTVAVEARAPLGKENGLLHLIRHRETDP